MFETIGFSIDYYIGNKFIGYTVMDEPEREVNGYRGRRIDTLQEDVICTNKKRIKAGEVVKTEQVQMYGKPTKETKLMLVGVKHKV